MGKPAVTITLSVAERREMEALARRHKAAQGLARRSRILLAADDALENKAIVEKLGVDANTVGKWRRRFTEQRLDGLYLDLNLVMDNRATHKTPAIRKWFARRRRWHVHFSPTGASWLNRVERVFAMLTEKQLRRGVHRSTGELERDILATIKRFCLTTLQIAQTRSEIIRTAESGH